MLSSRTDHLTLSKKCHATTVTEINRLLKYFWSNQISSVKVFDFQDTAVKDTDNDSDLGQVHPELIFPDVLTYQHKFLLFTSSENRESRIKAALRPLIVRGISSEIGIIFSFLLFLLFFFPPFSLLFLTFQIEWLNACFRSKGDTCPLLINSSFFCLL
jgi:hypothetical protein